MQTTITIAIREVYGKPLYYPADNTARIFARLVGRKTLTLDDLRTIKQLGYRIEIAEQSATTVIERL